jgi:glycosyltransferase involved in cell wall biosynthesis
VITTANADVLFSLVDHHNVLLVPPDDPLGLKQAIDELITSPLIRAQIGSRGQELFEQEFSWAAIADRLLRVYGELQ